MDLGVEKSETQADLLEASAEAPAMGSQRVEIHLPGELLNELLVKWMLKMIKIVKVH